MSNFYIRPSRDIRTNYSDISKLCKERPVAVTVNGREDTVIMSHEQFIEQQEQIEELQARLKLYSHLAQAQDDLKLGRVQPADKVFADIKADLKAGKL
jgi:PHD/YefM family antitoxin component YafN of YafNO toxin-antitoxin module